MKKITSILAVLLLMVANSVFAQYKGVQSVQPVPGTNYLLTNSDQTYYVTYSGAMTSTADDDTYLWQVEDAGNGQYYLKANNGKYIQKYDVAKAAEGLDGYDMFNYAGFNFSLGEKSGAMPIEITYASGTCKVHCGQTDNDDIKKFYLGNQGNNVSMDPWTEGGQDWMFMTVETKSLADLIADVYETCSSDEYPAGNGGGQYPEDKVKAFNDARDAAYDVVAGLKEGTQEILDNLKNALADVKASMNPYDGYYQIINAYSMFNDNMGIYVSTSTKGISWKSSEGQNTNPEFAWEVRPTAGGYTIKNISGDYYMGGVKTSTDATAVTTATDNQIISLGGVRNNHAIVKFSAVGAANNQFYHANSHNSGAGTSGTIVGWSNNGDDATTWIFVAIDDADVKTMQDKISQDKIDAALAELVAKATSKYDMNIDKTNKTSEALITDASQINANGTQETTEGSIESLIDGLYNTATDGNFYHSSWSATTEDYHSLTFTFNEAEQNLAFMSWRRCGQTYSPNRPTFVELYGSNDGENWTKAWILSTELPSENVGTSDTVYNSMAIDLGAPYKYVKFVVKKTNNGANEGSHPFFTYCEFNWYEAEIAADAKIKSMTSASALYTAIREALNANPATQETVDKLQTAYDAFMKDFADPTDLEDAITAATTKKNSATVGTDDGQYNQSDIDALAAAIEKAQAVLNTEYTKATLSTALDELNAAVTTFDNAKIKGILANHWYYIRTHASNTVTANSYIYSDPLNPLVGNRCYHWTSTVPAITSISSDSLDQIKGYIFRLIETDVEGVYAIQDANGLFINNEETGADGSANTDKGIIGTGFAHKLFKIYDSTMGEGGHEIRVSDESQAALHTSASGRLVNWANNGNKGSFYFISVPDSVLEALDMTSTYEVAKATWVDQSFEEGYQVVTCPVEICGMYGEAYCLTTEDDEDADQYEVSDGHFVYYKMYGEESCEDIDIPAGMPFIYNAPSDDEQFVFGTKATTTAGSNMALVGTLAKKTGLTNAYAISSNLTEQGTSITECAAYSGYIDDSILTAIKSLKSNLAEKNGNIYNMAGQKVSKAIKGVYIINGKKVIK